MNSTISPITIYLWQLADRLWPALFFLAAVFAFVGFLLLMAHYDEGYDTKKPGFLFAATSVLLAGAAILVPTSNTIAMMVIFPRIAESKVLQQDVPDIYNAAVQAVKDALKKK